MSVNALLVAIPVSIVGMLMVVHGAMLADDKPHEFRDVNRIDAIGDLHGDWDGHMATMRAARLVDER